AVISAKRQDYISEVTTFLKDTDPNAFVPMNTKDQDLRIVAKDSHDEIYRLLMQRAMEDESLSYDLRNVDKWVAFAVKAHAPTMSTALPIPGRFEKTHTTRLFVVVNKSQASKQPELASLGEANESKKDIWPLIKFGISPTRPLYQSQRTDL